jgi:hypothetical protein
LLWKFFSGTEGGYAGSTSFFMKVPSSPQGLALYQRCPPPIRVRKRRKATHFCLAIFAQYRKQKSATLVYFVRLTAAGRLSGRDCTRITKGWIFLLQQVCNLSERERTLGSQSYETGDIRFKASTPAQDRHCHWVMISIQERKPPVMALGYDVMAHV